MHVFLSSGVGTNLQVPIGLKALAESENCGGNELRSLKARTTFNYIWNATRGSKEANTCARGVDDLWTGNILRFTTSGESVRVSLTQNQAVGDCVEYATGSTHDPSSAISSEGETRECQHLLWKTFFEDHTRWWDNRHHKRNPSSPDFRHKESGEALWLDNMHKPTWVDAKLAILDSRIGHGATAAPPSSLSLPSAHTDQFTGPVFGMRVTPEYVKKLCRQGQVKEAVEALAILVGMHCGFDKYLFYSVLKECVVKKDVVLGGQVHALAVKIGFASDTFLCNHFIRMYAGHGQLQEAMEVFSGVALPNAFMWSSIISAHVKQGQAKRAIELYQHMRGMKMKPDGHVLVAALQACAAARDLQSGQQVRDDVLTSGMEHDMYVCNCLVDMFAKCGSLKDARRLFDSLGEKNLVTWSAMIAGYARVKGMGQEALGLYNAMQSEGMGITDALTFRCLLQACVNVGVSALETGKQLHSQLKERKLECDVVLGGSLVNMYVKCGSLEDARLVFDRLGQKNVVTWTAMIAGYAQQEGMGQVALSLYRSMQNEGMAVPDRVALTCLLQAIANVGVPALDEGKQLHSQIKELRLESDIFVGGSLVNMYAKCGSLKDARIVFDGLDEKNVVTWTAMIAGYAQQEGMGQEALSLYRAMHNESTAVPNAVTYVCLLQACANMGVAALQKGKQLHSELNKQRLESDMVVGGSLVNMYVKCGSLEDARIVFDRLDEKNVVTWTAMITGYAQHKGLGQEALTLYSSMHKQGVAAPDAVTFSCLLQACANVGVSAIETGKQLHLQLKDRRLESDVVVGGSVVNMYVKCGCLQDARVVFDRLGAKNVVTWTAMIAGYAQQEGMGQEALNIYNGMRNEGVVPNALTYACLVEACASVGALQQGKQLHEEILEGGFESDPLVAPCLLKMYAKCGCLDISREVFDRLPTKNLVTWTALLNGYAEHGESDMAIQCFEELLEQGMQPDEVTYMCLFTACSHAGLVDQGQQYFETMVERHGIMPNDKLYCCMVDLFGRSGQLDRAEEMLQASGLAGSAVSWTALLSACKSFGDAETGRRCFDQLVKLERSVATAYVLLGSIYANAGRWDEVERVESLRKAAGAKKMPAKACIEVKEEVHEFTVGEERSDVAATVRKMSTKVKEAGGHVPQTQLILRTNVSEQEKEDALCGHAEKLALAYGLLNTPTGSTLFVTKNLRMCNDCHSSTKIMSQLEKREIVVRDGHKVHRFRNGACSCKDRA